MKRAAPLGIFNERLELSVQEITVRSGFANIRNMLTWQTYEICPRVYNTIGSNFLPKSTTMTVPKSGL